MYASILDISWSLLFQIINFCILLFFLSKFLYKPINDMFEARKKDISENLDKAEEEKRLAQQLKLDYELKIKNANSEAQEIVHISIKNANTKSDQIITSTMQRVKSIEEESALEIENQKIKAFNDLKSDISVIAIQLASKILEKEIKEEDQDRIVDDFINDIGGKKWQI